MTSCLLIFVRLPVPGKVKTRLAGGVGAQDACTFYKCCAEHALKQAASCRGVDVRVYCSEASEQEDVKRWVSGLGLGFSVHSQVSDSNLGARMLSALKDALDDGASKVAIIGTDVPDMNADVIAHAFCLLDSYDLVLGPSFDGGYYLLGLTRIEPSLFQGIQWSTSTVHEETLSNAVRLGLRTAPRNAMPTWEDIDTMQDLQAWHQTRGGRDQHVAKEHPLQAIVADILARNS
eukprot:evm.model.scf_854.1 EVM.evm.TU.scf_854.1   scf_854:4314-7481(-)